MAIFWHTDCHIQVRIEKVSGEYRGASPMILNPEGRITIHDPVPDVQNWNQRGATSRFTKKTLAKQASFLFIVAVDE